MKEPTVQQRAIRRLLGALFALFALLVIGTVGYHWLENMDVVDALYMAVITVSTVGFGEVQQLDPPGRIFTIALIVGGGGIAAYSLSAAAEFFLSGEWRMHLEMRRQQQALSRLSQHTIVAGYGRLGRHIVDEMVAQGLPFVVIDPDADKIESINNSGMLAVRGNAANDDDLRRAGIERAYSLVAAASSDAENVFIVLTARSLRPDLIIVARANDDISEDKLRRAGASRVLLPYRISGRRIVTLLMRPHVADFFDEVMHASELEFVVEQVLLDESSPLVGHSLGKVALRSQFGVTVLACHLPSGKLNTSPSADMVLQAGSHLIVLGTREELQKFMQVAKAGSEPPVS